jgi:hypothetical protein
MHPQRPVLGVLDTVNSDVHTKANDDLQGACRVRFHEGAPEFRCSTPLMMDALVSRSADPQIPLIREEPLRSVVRDR